MGAQTEAAVILPWYEEEDFGRLMDIGGRDGEPRETYQLWYRDTMQTVDELLRSGQQIAFVTVRPAPYLTWLGGRPNTIEARLQYVTYLQTGG
jgi:hypothetical protein